MKSIILILFISVISKEYWECTDSLHCDKESTCCHSKTDPGWACYPTKNGVCCSDGESACPNGYTCNMNDKRCDKKN